MGKRAGGKPGLGCYSLVEGVRTNLCRVMEAYDRVARPWLYPWLNSGETRERPTARRASLPRTLPLSRAPIAQQKAA